MIDIAKVVADARFSIVTTLDTGETVIAKARTQETADRIVVMAERVLGHPDYQGRVRVCVELIDALA